MQKKLYTTNSLFTVHDKPLLWFLLIILRAAQMEPQVTVATLEMESGLALGMTFRNILIQIHLPLAHPDVL